MDKTPGIICDLDGTIALMKGHRTPFEGHKCHNDFPNTPIIDLLEILFRAYSKEYNIKVSDEVVDADNKNIDVVFTTARMNKPLDSYCRIDTSTKNGMCRLTGTSDIDEIPRGNDNVKSIGSLAVGNYLYGQFDGRDDGLSPNRIFVNLKDVYGLSLLWILQHVNIPYENMVMFIRKDEDYDKDRYVKLELYNKYIKPYWDIKMVLDDRDQVVEMWRHGAKLPCLQVADGNF